MSAVNELVTKFSFVGSLAPQAKFNTNLSRSIGLLGKMGIAASAAAAGVSVWVNSVASSLDPMIQLSRSTGVGIEAIQKLGFAASVSGSSAQAMQSSLQRLSKTIGDASRGMGPSVEAFSRLGISVLDASGNLKSADQVFNDVRQSVQRLNLPLNEQRSLMRSMGIDQSLIQMLGATDSEMAKLTERAEKLGVINQEQADQLARYNDSITTVKFGLGALQNSITLGITPAMTSLSEKFVGFLENNRDLIQNGIERTVEAFSQFMQAINRLMPVIAAIGLAFLALKIKAMGLVAVMGLLLSPVVLISAGIAALLFVVDDLIVAFQGGDSVIAGFYSRLFGGRDLVEDLTGAFKRFKELAIDPVVEGFRQWFDILKNVWDVLGQIGSFSIDTLVPDWMRNPFGRSNDNITPNDALAMSAGGATTSNRNVNQDIEINIATSDPVRAGEAVSDSLQNQLNSAQTQANRGGL
jgi:hypothetical protein